MTTIARPWTWAAEAVLHDALRLRRPRERRDVRRDPRRVRPGGGASSTTRGGGVQTPARGSQRAHLSTTPRRLRRATSQAKDAMPTHGQATTRTMRTRAAAGRALPRAARGRRARRRGRGDDRSMTIRTRSPRRTTKWADTTRAPGRDVRRQVRRRAEARLGRVLDGVARDRHEPPGAPGAARVALKIQRSAPEYYRAAHSGAAARNVMKKVDEQVANIAPAAAAARPVLGVRAADRALSPRSTTPAARHAPVHGL